MCDSTENGNGCEQNDGFFINFNQDFTYVYIIRSTIHYLEIFVKSFSKFKTFIKQRNTL